MDPRTEQEVLLAMEAGARSTAAPPEIRAALPARAYADPQRHARELERVFRASWIPACRSAELAEAGDFATLDLAGDRLAIVRRSNGALVALHNVCRHRGAQILRAPRGRVAELHCPYHGFRYGLDGALVAAPCPDALPPRARPGSARLPVAASAEYGGWLWVHLGADPEPLERALGRELIDELDHWSLAELEVKAERTLAADFDWKIGVEAFLEPFHVPAIHARSAHPLVDFRGLARRDLGPHSRMALPFRAPGAYAPEGVLGAVAGAAGVEPFARLNRAQRTAHFVYFVFPCTVLMLFPTHALFLRFLPEAPGRCALRYELLGAPARTERAAAYYAGLAPGYDRLLEEDLANLPWIQRGSSDRTFEGGALSGYEARIAAFWEALALRLDR